MPGERPPKDDLQAYGYRSGVVSLGKAAAEVPVPDQIALRDQGLRETTIDRILPAFLRANALTLGAVGVLWIADELNMVFHVAAPGDRIITSHVIMTLLGATTVQVGVIAATIARYLFPGRP